jgi:hypothetical protein
MNQHPPKSKGEMIIERLMEELDPESDRYRVLATAKRFKSSWVELGERLLLVQREQFFRQWGYETFEDYCAKEIRIQKPTAQKLTHAYRYLEQEEPEILARRTEIKPLPDYRSVDLLRQAREEKGFSPEEYSQLRQAIIEEERSHPTVMKRFKEFAASREDLAENGASSLKAAQSAARRLCQALEALSEVPAEFVDSVSRLSAWLETGEK